jgi:hypothetical protein
MSIDEHESVGPNPRREDPRSAPMIEGAATQIEPNESDPSEMERTQAVAPDAPAAHEPAQRTGRTSASIALALSVLAAAGVGALAYRDLSAPSIDPARLDQIDARVAALQKQAAASGDLDTRIATLERSARSIGDAARAAQAQAAAAMDAAKSASNTARDAQQTAAKQPAAVAQAAQSAQSDAAALARLEARVGALESRPDPAKSVAQIVADQSDLSGKVAALSTQIAALEKTASDLNASISEQKKTIAPLQALLDQPKIDPAAIKAQTQDALQQSRAAALTVVARAIQASVDSGRPYQADLDAARRLGADASMVSALAASAASGAATPGALQQSFQRLVESAPDQASSPVQGGLMNRLAREAGRLVEIRSDKQAGGSSSAPAAHVESALARGDIAGALAARHQLSPSELAKTQDWAKQAQSALDARAAADSLLKGATDRLGKAPA